MRCSPILDTKTDQSWTFIMRANTADGCPGERWDKPVKRRWDWVKHADPLTIHPSIYLPVTADHTVRLWTGPGGTAGGGTGDGGLGYSYARDMDIGQAWVYGGWHEGTRTMGGWSAGSPGVTWPSWTPTDNTLTIATGWHFGHIILLYGTGGLPIFCCLACPWFIERVTLSLEPTMLLCFRCNKVDHS